MTQKEKEGFMSPSETQPVLDEELKSAGVKHHSEQPELTQEHVDIGVKPSLESNPVSMSDSGKIILPITEEEAEKVLLGKSSTDSSLKWLAVLIVKHFKRIHSRITNT